MDCCFGYINASNFDRDYCGIIKNTSQIDTGNDWNSKHQTSVGLRNNLSSNDVYANDNATLSNKANLSYTYQLEDEEDHISKWFNIAIRIICIVGIVGNLMNLLVLASRRITSRLDSVARAVNYGLVALALSDLLLCVVVFPHSFIPTHEFNYVMEKDEIYKLYYRIYGVAFINLFQMTSTWLIVIMSISRYFGVRDPLHARNHIWTRQIGLLIISVFVCSSLITLPHFMYNSVQGCRWKGKIYYEALSPWGDHHLDRMHIYMRWFWPIFASFLPILMLLVCNSRLIRELNNAYQFQRTMRTRNEQQQKHANHIVTLTLVSIVVLQLILVAPAEILRYINPYEHWGHAGYVIANFANVMQTLNFAVNFILYCVVNIHFRRTIRAWIYVGLNKICRTNFSMSPVNVSGTKNTSFRKTANIKIQDGSEEDGHIIVELKDSQEYTKIKQQDDELLKSQI